MAIILPVVAIVLACLATSTSSKFYLIVPENSTSLCQHYHNMACYTLDQLQHHLPLHFRGNYTLNFESGEHILTWNMKFSHSQKVLFTSKHLESIPRITCAPNTGIDIEHSSIHIQGLMIHGCKRNKNGGALAVRYGCVYLKSTQFSNNRASDNQNLLGGAVFLYKVTAEIEHCSFMNNSVQSGNGGALFTIDSEISLNSCTFKYNHADHCGGAVHSKKNDMYSSSRLQIYSTIFQYNTADRGGAIFSNGYTVISHSSPRNIIISKNSTYDGNMARYGSGCTSLETDSHHEGDTFKNNRAERGAAALYLEKSSANFHDCIITNNTASGASIGALFGMHSKLTFNGSTTFMNNSGILGGAITCIISSVSFIGSSTYILRNKARYGGGIYLDRSTMSGCNYVQIANNTAVGLGGGVYATNSQIDMSETTEKSHSLFIENNIAKKGGGLHLITSSLTITSGSTFKNNTAMKLGGGIYLEGGSRINLGKQESILKMYMNFDSNTAKRGGAIYVLDSTNEEICAGVKWSTANQKRSKQCFLQISNYYLYFGTNYATDYGSDIYGGLLDRCTTSKFNIGHKQGLRYHYQNGISELQTLIHTKNSYNLSISQLYNRISSDPVQVCFCVNDIIKCDYTHPTVSKKRGETFTLDVAAVDQVGKPVNATLISSLGSKNGRFNDGQRARQIGAQCTKLQYNIHTNNKLAKLELYAKGPCGNLGLSRKSVDISFLPCTCSKGLQPYPPISDCICDCDKSLQHHINITNCSPENGTVQLNLNVWINVTKDTSEFVTHDCLFDYCLSKPLNISLGSPRDIDRQCAFNRTGRLCGQCAQGLSLVFASSRCLQCSNYYLFLLLPFALAGIALVAFILLLNITVATGTIHGFIFYANILAANQSTFLPFKGFNILTVFISWLNLDLGIETCFYNGMDSYSKFLLQLVFPAYVFILIAIIMVLCNCSPKIAKLLGQRNPEATLYTLVLLSYSKLVQLIITALHFSSIRYPNTVERVWSYDANIPYFSINHIPRFLAAFIITVSGAVYTTLLLFSQLFNRCSEHRLMKWTNHRYYIHFIKAHHAPLSDKHRYWVGLLLLVRLVHYLISVFADDQMVTLLIGILAFILLLLKHNKQIYKIFAVDLLEIVLIFNLGVLAIATLYVRGSHGNQQALTSLSISVSFIAFLGMVLYHILDTCGVKLIELASKVIAKLKKPQHYQPVAVMEEQLDSEDDDELLIQLDNVYTYADNDTNYDVNDPNDPVHYITPPIVRPALPANQLREPALDILIPVQPEDYHIPPAPRPQHTEPTFTEVVLT